MVKKIIIGNHKFTFVFRHKWDSKDGSKYNFEFRNYDIGFWFRLNKIVGRKDFSNPKEWSNNLVKDYTVGVNLIICKMWVSYNKGGMIF